jgi:myo-inositol-1(or 4)-monophosphatase
MARRKRSRANTKRPRRPTRRERPLAAWPKAGRRAAGKSSAARGGRIIALTPARRRAVARRRQRAKRSPGDEPVPVSVPTAADFHLATCIACAHAGGRVLMEYWGRRGGLTVEEKGRSDYVTVADREAEEAILRLIRARFPDHAIMAEESDPVAGASGYRWYVDPLDGTTNYIHGYPLFGVSVGLADAQGMCAAAVYDPVRNEMFTAARGCGAYLNGDPIRVSPLQALEQGLIVTGVPFRSLERLDQYLASFRAVILRSAGIRRDGSAALNLAYVACGRYDGFWEMSLSSWDVAAGSLIVSEAGGVVTDFQGRNRYIESGDIIASNPRLHPALFAIVREAYRQA